jgi:hypothetical protein
LQGLQTFNIINGILWDATFQAQKEKFTLFFLGGGSND